MCIVFWQNVFHHDLAIMAVRQLSRSPLLCTMIIYYEYLKPLFSDLSPCYHQTCHVMSIWLVVTIVSSSWLLLCCCPTGYHQLVITMLSTNWLLLCCHPSGCHYVLQLVITVWLSQWCHHVVAMKSSNLYHHVVTKPVITMIVIIMSSD